MKLKITIIGAGRTGRGMLGELFHADSRFNIAFADIDANLINGLNKQGYYTINMTDLLSGDTNLKHISPFLVFDINKNRIKYLDYLSESDFIATALFPEAFDSAITDICAAIKLRIQKKINKPMAILLGANYVGLYDYFYPRIIQKFTLQDELDYVEKYISVVTTNANRKVVYPDQYGTDQFLLESDNKPILMVEDNFKFADNFKLPNFFVPIKHVEIKMIEKIWSENLEHISLAFLGNFYGYKTINEAISNSYIRKVVYHAWKESRLAMFNKYNLAIPDDDFKQQVYQKFASPYFSDKLTRIGRDTTRKLKKMIDFLDLLFFVWSKGSCHFSF